MRSWYDQKSPFRRRRGRGILSISLNDDNCLVIDNDPLITVSVELVGDNNCLAIAGKTPTPVEFTTEFTWEFA